jgi:hypothetical protein
MEIDLDGDRPRYFHERLKVEGQQGSPVRRAVSKDARERLMREVVSRAYERDPYGGHMSFLDEITNEVHRVIGVYIEAYAAASSKMTNEHFLTVLEVALMHLWSKRRKAEDIDTLQSILADDLSAFRIRRVGIHLHLVPVDNPHLHTEIVDRTFELTQNTAFASAQRDYTEAWTHYLKGDFDDAILNAHKAFESAAKVVIKRVDPSSAPENLQTNRLVPELVRLEIIPQGGFATMADNLRLMLLNSGVLRNKAGTGHGSIDLSSPEASVAVLGLRLSGTLISFLCERWEQMKPSAKNRKT